MGAALHSSGITGVSNSGFGLTSIVKVCISPTQLLADGTIEIVAICSSSVLLFAVNGLIFPVPEAPRPIFGLSLVHFF